MCGHLKVLTELGILERRRLSGFPGPVDYALRRPGVELCTVADVVQAWLDEAPSGRLQLGSAAAKSMLRALVDGWVTNIVRALCAKQLSLTELNSLIPSISYPSLERRVTAMRLAGQIQGQRGVGRSTPYVVSTWLRRAVAPLVTAMRWEQHYVKEQSAPPTRLDAEAILLLLGPLLRLDAGADGACRLVFEMGHGENQRLSGVTVVLRGGRPTSCLARLDVASNASASGSPGAWFDAILDGTAGRLELAGDSGFARNVVEALHGSVGRPSMTSAS